MEAKKTRKFLFEKFSKFWSFFLSIIVRVSYCFKNSKFKNMYFLENVFLQFNDYGIISCCTTTIFNDSKTTLK